MAGVSLFIQDSEIAESQGIFSPKQDDAPVSAGVQDPQETRRRASTGSSTISDAGSEIDGFGQPLQSYGMWFVYVVSSLLNSNTLPSVDKLIFDLQNANIFLLFLLQNLAVHVCHTFCRV